MVSIRNSWRMFLTHWMEIWNCKGFQYDVPHPTFYLEKYWGWFLHSALRYQFITGNIRNVPERAFLMMMMSISDFKCTNGFVLQILTIWCITLFSIFTIEKDRFGINKELMEDVPDSLDGDHEPQYVPIWCSWPHFSFGKGLVLIPSFSSEISV